MTPGDGIRRDIATNGQDMALSNQEHVKRFLDPSRLWQSAVSTALRFMQDGGIDLELGGRLYRMCRSRGLLDVHAEGRVSTEGGGSIYASCLAYGIRHFGVAGAMASLGQDGLDRTLVLLAARSSA